MASKTFKEISKETDIKKEVKKVGLSLGIIFSKEDLERYNIEYEDTIILNEAKIDKRKNI